MNETTERRLQVRHYMILGMDIPTIIDRMRDANVTERTIYNDVSFIRQGGLDEVTVDGITQKLWELYYRNIQGKPQQSVAIKALENMVELHRLREQTEVIQGQFVEVKAEELGVIDWGIEVFNLYPDFPIFNAYGGRGRGASVLMGQIVVKAMLQFGHNCLIAREFQKSLDDSNISLIKDIIDNSIYAEYFDTTKRDRIICELNGAVCDFKGIRHKLNSWRSIHGYQLFHFEEARENTDDQWQVILPSLRDDNQTILASWNPELKDEDVERLLDKEGAINIKSTYAENPFFPDTLNEQRLEDMKMYSPELYEHVWEGEYKPQDGAAYFNYKIVDGVTVEYIDKEDKGFARVAGLDVAGSISGDYTALVIQDEFGNEIFAGHKQIPNLRDRITWVYNHLSENKCSRILIDCTGGRGEADLEALIDMDIDAEAFIFNRTSKPRLLDRLGMAMADKEIKIVNQDVVKELKDLGDDGKALTGHDDYVMALALAVEAHSREVDVVGVSW